MMAEHLCKLAFVCLRDTDGTQSVPLVFSCTKEDEGAERKQREQSAFVTSESHELCHFNRTLPFCLPLLLFSEL